MSEQKPDYFNAAWFNDLVSEVNATSVTAVAAKMGVARSSLSVLVNGIGAYGSGKACTYNMEKRYRQAFEQIACPHTGSVIGMTVCRDMALRAAPSHNPIQMMHWQACQSCPNKPEPTLEAKKPLKVKIASQRKTLKDESQQAGIVDKVTLPLPEVGGPQINQETV